MNNTEKANGKIRREMAKAEVTPGVIGASHVKEYPLRFFYD